MAPIAPLRSRRGAGRRTRRRVVVLGVATLAALAAVVGGPWLYARLAPEPPEALALTASSAATGSPTTAGAVQDGTWTVAAGSEAGYRIDEVLSGQPVTVVGRTAEVDGSVVIENETLVSADVSVDVASVATDEPGRDAYFRRALHVTEVPEARFTLTGPVDLAPLSATGGLTVEAAGTLTLNGVMRPVTVSLEARRTADGGVEVAGSVPVVLTDHDLTAPDLGFVTVQPEGVVELLLLLTR